MAHMNGTAPTHRLTCHQYNNQRWFDSGLPNNSFALWRDVHMCQDLKPDQNGGIQSV